MDKEDFFDEARRIVTAFSNTNPVYNHWFCFFCGDCSLTQWNTEIEHSDDCIWLAARKLIEN